MKRVNGQHFVMSILLSSLLKGIFAQTWHPFPSHSTEYMVSTWAALTYFEAENMCLERNAQLVILKDPDVRTFVIDLVESVGVKGKLDKVLLIGKNIGKNNLFLF